MQDPDDATLLVKGIHEANVDAGMYWIREVLSAEEAMVCDLAIRLPPLFRCDFSMEPDDKIALHRNGIETNQVANLNGKSRLFEDFTTQCINW
jgi:hypothetical protein